MMTLQTLLNDKTFVLTPCVVGFLVRGQEVLLGERKKVSQELGQGLLSGIGGKTEKDESSEKAFVREVEEEIGITPTGFAKVGRVKFFFPHKSAESKWSQEVDVFLTHEWQGEPKETEAIKPMWFALDKVPWERMWPDAKYWLPQILTGIKVETAYLYDENSEIIEYRVQL
jgi:8-oxo-dGTP diphosphatase